MALNDELLTPILAWFRNHGALVNLPTDDDELIEVIHKDLQIFVGPDHLGEDDEVIEIAAIIAEEIPDGTLDFDDLWKRAEELCREEIELDTTDGEPLDTSTVWVSRQLRLPNAEEGVPQAGLDSQVDFDISEWLDIAMSIRDIFESRGPQIIDPVDPTGENLSDVRAIDELKAMIGTEELVEKAEKLEAMCHTAAKREKKGLKDDASSPHLVFTGNPGTGKTTVARFMGKLFKEVGLLEKGHVVHARRSDLIGAYTGQTTPMTLAVIEKAMGGILFIDEAYALNDAHWDSNFSYGQECVAALLQEMENRHNKFVVIVAGYPDEMKLLIDSNPGLESRFDETWHFRDYTNDELLSIVKLFVSKGDYVLSPDCDKLLLDHLKGMTRNKNFGNARVARKIFQQVRGNHAIRVKNLGLSSREDLMTIIPQDITFENRSKPQKRYGYL